MSEFTLNRNWNGSFKGETVKVSDHLDGEMVRNRIGVRIEKAKVKAETAPKNITITEEGEGLKAVLKAPKNKAIQSTPRNKKK